MCDINFIKNYVVDCKELGNKESKDKVVVIHGAWFTIDSMLDYANQFTDKHVICLSLPNRKGFKDDVKEVTVEMYADAIFAKLSELIDVRDRENNVSLHGWSLGGTTSMMLAKKYPKVFKSIVCIFSSPDWKDLKLPQPGSNFVKNLMVVYEIVTLKSKDLKFSAMCKLIKKYFKNTSDYSACVADGIAISKFRVDGQFKDIQIPVYVIKGEIDSLVGKDNLELFYKELSNVSISELKGKGHMTVIEDGKYVADMAKQLLEWDSI